MIRDAEELSSSCRQQNCTYSPGLSYGRISSQFFSTMRCLYIIPKDRSSNNARDETNKKHIKTHFHEKGIHVTLPSYGSVSCMYYSVQLRT